MLEHLKVYAKTHLFYIVLILVGLVGFRAWSSEHDRAVKADALVSASESRVKALEDEVTAVKAAAARQVQVIVKERDAIKTPVQALPVVDAFDPALKPRILPENPSQVSVDAVTLAKDLEACRIDRVNLGACTKELELKDREIVEKTDQVTQLKKKPRLFKRFTDGLKSGAVWTAVGITIAKVLL